MEEDYRSQIDALDLSDRQKLHLKHRWLGQLEWFSDKSTSFKKLYQRLKLTSIICGVLVTASASMMSAQPNSRWQRGLSYFTIGTGLAIAAANALEEFFGPKEIYLNYRKTSELLISEGCLYFNEAGPYRGKKPAQAYEDFVEKVELIIKNDVEAFITLKSQEGQEKTEGEKSQMEKPPSNSPLSVNSPPTLSHVASDDPARDRALAKLARSTK